MASKAASLSKIQPDSVPVHAEPDRLVDGDNQLLLAIGRQVSRLRTQQQLTSLKLAERAGISPTLLSRLEHGGVSPSLRTISQLAQALNVPITALFQQVGSSNRASHIRAGSGMAVKRAGSADAQNYELIGMPMDGDVQVEPYLITVDEARKPKISFQHEGVELIYMLKGGMVYRHGGTSYKLLKGDSLFFDARQQHGPEEFLKVPTKFLSFISYRRN